MKIKTKKSKLKTIGIELPFGWCLVKGSKLRELQSELREEKFKAAYQEQIENNPDRPTNNKYFYVCNHCGLKYSVRPDNCRGCNSTSFGKRKKEQG